MNYNAEKIRYAVMRDNEDNDWGYGSADLDEARAMLRTMKENSPEAYIAVIDDGIDPICIDELRD